MTRLAHHLAASTAVLASLAFAGVPMAASAQAYNPSAAVYGKSHLDNRKQCAYPVQPKGGDYTGANDADVSLGNAIAWATCAVILDPSTGLPPVTPTGGSDVNIKSYGGTLVDPNAVTPVSEAAIRAMIATAQFQAAPGSYAIVGGQRDTSGTNLSNGAVKALALDVKGNALMAICNKDLTSCQVGSAVDDSLTGTTTFAMVTYAQCDTDDLPATTTNNRFGPLEKDCSTGGQITAPFGQKSGWWSKDELILTNATETLVASADTTRQRCVTDIHLSWNTLGAATKWELRDGASGTVKVSGYIGTAAGQDSVSFTTPRCGTLNTGLYAALTPTPTSGSVSFSFGGRLLKP